MTAPHPSPAPERPTILFAYDASRQALVMQAHDGSDRAFAVTVRELQAMGWQATHEGLAASLPRFGPPPPPPVIQPAHDMRAAQALAKGLNGLKGQRR